MRYVIVGAGAVGGALGALLSEAGRPVQLVARGDHGEAIRAHGLTLRRPARTIVARPPCVSAVREAAIEPTDVVILGVKAQDAPAVLAELPAHATVLCTQNGVATEPLAAACVARVYAAMVWIPAVYLSPGVVEVHADTPAAVLRVGRYPEVPADDALAHTIATDLVAADVDASAVPDPMPIKRGKLLTNLGNILDAFAVSGPGVDELAEAAAIEGAAVLERAGLSFVPRDVLVADMLSRVPRHATIDGRARGGGSTWQSAARGRDTEVDALHGWLCRLGESVGVPTPVNAGLWRLPSVATGPRSVPLAVIQELIVAG